MTLLLVFAAASASGWFLLSASARREAQIERVRSWGAAATSRRARPQVDPRGAVLVLAAAGVGLLAAHAVHAAPLPSLVLVVCFAAAGVVVPRTLAGSRRERRADAVRAALPDALDLLSIGVTAGLSLDAAIGRLVEAGDGPLVEELSRVLVEIRVGEGRDRALARMAERVAAAEVSTLVRSLVQAEHLGVPLAETLHAQAEDARRRRVADAEERAGKAPVKMLLPTALFIFPALFVVVLAPAILELTRQM